MLNIRLLQDHSRPGKFLQVWSQHFFIVPGQDVREELRSAAKKLGKNFDDMCSSDNSLCPE